MQWVSGLYESCRATPCSYCIDLDIHQQVQIHCCKAGHIAETTLHSYKLFVLIFRLIFTVSKNVSNKFSSTT